MRRSTAAAVGTLTGAALILGVRLSATAAPLAAPPAFDASAVGADNARPTPTPASRGKDLDKADRDKADRDDGADRGEGDDAEPAAEPTRRQQQREEDAEREESGSAGGLRDGTYKGSPVSNPYGSVQVAITVSGGRVTDAAANYPTTGQSASINAAAIPKLRQATIQAQSAEIDAVSGATATSESYTESLQAALDAARG
jgi:uncharacterized protein with FMN-binding domain